MQHREVLLVEDNPGDVVLLREAFKEAAVRNNLSVVRDGEEAIEYLRRSGRHIAAIRPDLILLDLNLPKRNGREVLQAIKTDPELCDIPVLILTSSSDERDVRHAYRYHANCYLTKPVDLNSFFEVVRSIDRFWLQLVQLPSRKQASAAY